MLWPIFLLDLLACLDVCSTCPRVVAMAACSLQEMLVVGERADAASFSTLIELCGAQGQLDTALQLIGYVQRLGMQRTVQSGVWASA